MKAELNRFIDQKIAVAVSGGVDSMALLHILTKIENRKSTIVALTVNHGLRAESANEAAAVKEYCKSIGVEHHTLVIPAQAGIQCATGIEEKARKARYDLMINWCKKNGVNVLTTAHQRDDNIETFFMNLARGSGVYGLAGMREVSLRDGLTLWRPLLNVSRAELEEYCKLHNLPTFHDPMNDNERFTRVKIRKHRHELGLSDERVALAIRHLTDARNLIDDHVYERIEYFGYPPVEFEAVYLLDSSLIGFQILKELLTKDGRHPRGEELERALEKLDNGDCKFSLGGYNIRRMGDKIRIWEEGAKFPESAKIKK